MVSMKQGLYTYTTALSAEHGSSISSRWSLSPQRWLRPNTEFLQLLVIHVLEQITDLYLEIYISNASPQFTDGGGRSPNLDSGGGKYHRSLPGYDNQEETNVHLTEKSNYNSMDGSWPVLRSLKEERPSELQMKNLTQVDRLESKSEERSHPRSLGHFRELPIRRSTHYHPPFEAFLV